MKLKSTSVRSARLVIRILLLLAIAHVAAPAATTPAFIQERDNQVTSGTTSRVTFSSPTATGNLIVVYVIWDNTGGASVSDSSGNLYVSAVGPSRWNSSKHSAQVFYAKNLKAGPNTVTASFATAVRSFGIVYAHEYSGVDQTAPIDVTAAAVGSSGSLSSGSVITTSATDLLFGAGVSMNVVTRPGTGYTARSTSQGNMTEDRIVSATGSYSATASNSGGAWAMQMVAFRAATGVQDTTSPTVPTGLSASALSSSQITLSWAPSTDPDNAPSQVSYGYYRNGVRVGTTPAGTTAWSDSGLAAATTYVYTVAAQDPAGNSSAQSPSVQATTLPLLVPVITSFSASPASITAGQSATLSWAVSNATSLTIDNGVGTVTGTSSTTVRPAAGTLYKLTATNTLGSVTAQASVAVTADTTPPTVPASLAAASKSASQIDLTWSASTDNVNVLGYQVYRNGLQIATTAAPSYSNMGLSANTTYSYSVVAYDAAGNTSPHSVPASATTSGADAQAPTISITSPTNGQIASGSVTITAPATDNVGVIGVRFYLDGAQLGQESTASPYSTTWNTSQASNASHLLTAVARDAAGNTTTSSGVTVTVSNGSLRPYSTTFSLGENPVSENGNWISGKAFGLDWADVRTTPGLAFGTQTGTDGGNAVYADSAAILSGNWGPDQTVQATVRTVNQNSAYFEEVELRLRSSITAHSSTGYEVLFACRSDGSQYVQVVRWNGPLANFTLLDGRAGPGLRNGDVVKATIVGNLISAYINNTLVLQVTDSTYSSGAPGMGFFLQNGTGVNSDYGFTSFTASDGSTIDTTPPSMPNSLSASGVSASQINLSWAPSTDNVVVAGYRVFRDNNQIATTTVNSFADAGLNANAQYTYFVSAIDGAGNVSPQSASVVAVTLSPDTIPPSVPSGLQSSNVASTSATVSWTASTDNVGVVGYQVFRDGTQVATPTSASHTDTGLAPLSTYAYTVAAYDYSNNISGQSQQTLVTTPAAAKTPPSLLQQTEAQISNGANVSVAFKTATRAGNAVVAYILWNNTGSVTVTDSQGNSFVSVSSPVTWGGGYSAQVFYATNVAGGADTVTASFRNSVTSFGVIYVHEYAGISAVSPVDVTVSASGSSALLSSGNATTTSANDLIFGAGVSDNVVTAAGSGFTARSLAYGNITEDRVAASAGSYSATATHNGSAWAMQMVAFRPAN